MQPDQLASLALTLLTTVALLVVISVGLAVIFGMMRIINLAHGEFLMLGAFATLSGVRAGFSLWLAMPLAALVVGAFGLAVERLLIRHLYGRLADTMLATWGLSLILVQAVVMLYGPATNGIPTPLSSFELGRYSVSEYSLVLIGAGLLLPALVWLVLTRTRYGVMARAATQLPEMAAAVGVNTSRMNMWSFAFGSALAGAGGALLAPLAGVVPSMGQAYIARAFMTVIVGGPQVITGTVAASGVLGGIEHTVSYLTTPFLGQGALLFAAVVLLRVLPRGLTGQRR